MEYAGSVAAPLGKHTEALYPDEGEGTGRRRGVGAGWVKETEARANKALLGQLDCAQHACSLRSGCERIDWTGGSDPQEVAWMAVTGPEADELIAHATCQLSGWESLLRSRAPGRAAWVRWFASDGTTGITATHGLNLGPHD